MIKRRLRPQNGRRQSIWGEVEPTVKEVIRKMAEKTHSTDSYIVSTLVESHPEVVSELKKKRRQPQPTA